MERLVDRRSHFFPKLMNVVPCNFHPSGNPRRRPLNFLGKARSNSRILAPINFKCLTLVYI